MALGLTSILAIAAVLAGCGLMIVAIIAVVWALASNRRSTGD